ncbi:uncharacterized protein LOC103578468 [Microplitis demolitor]|uniref:uncharacterized protein LOC103578468 n=1 Tax=Microplitis demolitor TaxID=69319 RepID=UPI0004CDA897|nr:uncharacterized protein LOC103578468 [Microplitis demolitor]XP_053596655.1 uncharacterized protein LOC103578468 [Microplitis demolitor]
MLGVFLNFCIVAGAFTQYVANGPCPKVIVEEPLDLERLSGLWIRYATSDFNSDSAQMCPQQFWSLPNDEGVSRLVSTSILSKTNKKLKTITDVSLTNNNALCFHHHVPIVGNIYREALYLGVDYDKYTVSWTCVNNGTTHIESIMIFTRERNPTIDILKIAKEAYARYGLVMSHVIRDNQDCF